MSKCISYSGWPKILLTIKVIRCRGGLLSLGIFFINAFILFFL